MKHIKGYHPGKILEGDLPEQNFEEGFLGEKGKRVMLGAPNDVPEIWSIVYHTIEGKKGVKLSGEFHPPPT